MSVQRMFYNGPMIKLLIMGGITLVLLLPLARVEYLISERQDLQYQAKANIAANWGEQKVLEMPVMAISYRRNIPTGFVFKEGGQQVKQEQHTVYVPAENMKVAVNMTTETRQYGIYSSPVYLIEVEFRGLFEKQTLRDLAANTPEIDWQQAELVLPISQPRSIRSVSLLSTNTEELSLSDKFNSKLFSGLSTRIPINLENDEDLSIALYMTLAGSESLLFQPMSGLTEVEVQSDWASPSFNGAFLPSKRTISAAGFSAAWSVMDLNLNLPRWWQDKDPSPLTHADSTFGFQLYQPVDIYQQNIRSIKYAVLVIVLSFMLFFLLEVYYRMYFHPIQYVMVGVALSLFYLLLVAFSEHVGFTTAYAIATAAVVVVVGFYASGILKSARKGFGIAVNTLLVYAFLFFLIRSQDYSLVIGATVLFAIFSLIMLLSRHVDWHQITQSSR